MASSSSDGLDKPQKISRTSSSSSTIHQHISSFVGSTSFPVISTSTQSPDHSSNFSKWQLNRPNDSIPGLSFSLSSSSSNTALLPPKKYSRSPRSQQRAYLTRSSAQDESNTAYAASLTTSVLLVENTLKLTSLGVSSRRPEPSIAPRVTLSNRCRPDPKVIFDQLYFTEEFNEPTTARRTNRTLELQAVKEGGTRKSLAGIGEEEGESSLHSSTMSFPSATSEIPSTESTNTFASSTSPSTAVTSFIPDGDSQSVTSTSSSIPAASKKPAWSTPKSWVDMATSRNSNRTVLGSPFSENVNDANLANRSPSHSISNANSVNDNNAPGVQRHTANGKGKKGPTGPISLDEVVRQAETRYVAPLTYPRGMINKGNFCFANAILQVLVYCAPFYNLFRLVGEHVAHDFHNSTPLMEAVIGFLSEFHPIPVSVQKALQETPSKAIDILREIDASSEPFAPEFLYDAMKMNKRFDTMRRGHQEDAEEFLGFFLDTLHEELLIAIRNSNDKLAAKRKQVGQAKTDDKQVGDEGEEGDDGEDTEEVKREVKRPTSPTEGDGWLEVGQKGKTSFTRTTSAAHSPITRIFGGKLRSVLKIPGSKDSVTLEPYQPLQLDIQPANVTTVGEALENLTVPEIITGLLSATTKLPVDATKQVFVETLPPILILHLKRFVYDDIGGVQKSSKVLGYGPSLEIAEDVISPSRRMEATRRYKLIGVIYHHGRFASGGHYTVDVLRQDQSEWIHIDDTTWSVVSPPSVRAGSDVGPGTKQHHDGVAYLLFYAREDVVPVIANGGVTLSDSGGPKKDPPQPALSGTHLKRAAAPASSQRHQGHNTK
ncbi:hypothetical protein CBS101457_006805 [Exobasidium rhododendri]|nr:hypothetical protein CBS101457_006805 [Exobasidium rhododendri]